MSRFEEFVSDQRWIELIEKAENPLGQKKAGETIKTVKIEVKEVLAVGQWHREQEAIAIVEDNEGKVWIVPEGDILTSRRDVKKGMKLRLKITEKTYFQQETEVTALE